MYNIPSFYSFLNARISPKQKEEQMENSSPDPSCGRKIQPKFWQILSPKNSFRKTESALVPPPAQKLLGQNPERKTPFPFSKEISPPPNQKCKECFSFGVAEALRGSGGTIHSSLGFCSKYIRTFSLPCSFHSLRKGRDSNPRYRKRYNSFRDCPIRPL